MNTGYEIEGPLAGGGQVTLLAARDRRAERAVVLRPIQAGCPVTARRLRLRHPALLQALDWTRIDGQTYAVEERLEGREFGTGRRGEVDAVLHDAAWLLAALAALHRAGLVHGDVHPNNMLLLPAVERGLPVLLDFGLARGPGGAAPAGASGTFGTLAPEAARGREAACRADLFALGTSLLGAWLGRRPDPRWSFDAAALEASLAGVPAALAPLLRALCAPDPAARAADAVAAARRLPARAASPAVPESWPLAGLAPSLARLRTWLGAGPCAVLVPGRPGSGRRSLAERCAREVRALALEGALPAHSRAEVVPLRAEDDLLRVAALHDGGDPPAVVLCPCAEAGPWRARLAAFARVEVLPPPRLEAAALAELLPCLPGTEAEDPVELAAESRGLPGRLAALLTGEGPPPPRPSGPVLHALIAASLVERGLPGGMVPPEARPWFRVRRDGRCAAADPEVARRLADEAAPDELRAAHALAARAAPDPASAAWHRFLAGSGPPPPAAQLVRARWGGRHPLEGPAGPAAAARVEADARALVRLRAGAARGEAADLAAALLRFLLHGRKRARVRELLALLAGGAQPDLRAIAGRLAFEDGDLRAAVRDLAPPARAGNEAAVLDLARVLQFLGRPAAADRLLDRRLTAPSSAVTAAAAGRIRSLDAFRCGRVDRAIAAARRALAQLAHRPASALSLGLEQNLALFLRHAGRVGEAAAIFERTAQGFARLGDLHAACIAWINAGLCLEDEARFDQAQELKEKAFRRASALGFAQPREVARAGLGITLGRRGDLPGAIVRLEEAARRLAEQGLARERELAEIHALAFRAELSGDAGCRARLERLFARAFAGRRPGAAAAAAEALAGLGAPLPGGAALRRCLRGSERSVRERLLFALRLQSPPPARRRGLERLARAALPPVRARALAELAAAAEPRAARPLIAAALRAVPRRAWPRLELDVLALAARAARRPGERRAVLRLAGATVARLASLSSPVEEDPALHRTWQRTLDILSRAARAASAPRSLEPLIEVNRLLLEGGLDDADRLGRILELAMSWAGAWRGLILERPPGGQPRILAARVRSRDGALEAREFAWSTSLVAEVFDSGRTRATVNALEDPELARAVSVVSYELHSIACAPIRRRGSVFGVLYLDHPFEEGAFAEHELALVDAFADQLSLAVEAAERRAEIERLNAELAERVRAREAELARARRELAGVRVPRPIVHRSQRMSALLETVRRIAVTDLPVHVAGETGTGKELIARRLHELSPRRDGPFIAENCSAIAGDVLESELFGHVRGAFTGAVRDKPGLFRMADGGTLFLDEIGDMPKSLQSRLLRVLAEGTVRPVGGDRSFPVDVRLVTATHRDLEALVRAGDFREDLYYRIVVTRIDVPPLRARPEDIAPLAQHFLSESGGPEHRFTPAALAALERYGWPGNVRELEHAVQSALVMARGPEIDLEDLPPAVRGSGSGPRPGAELPSLNLKALERAALEAALREAGGNRARAAKLLGISRSSVFVKIKEYGLK